MALRAWLLGFAFMGSLPGAADTVGTAPSEKAELAAGLWYGTVTVQAVASPAADIDAPAPTEAPFAFPVLIHIGPDGTAKLLQEAVIVRSPAPSGAAGRRDGADGGDTGAELFVDMRRLRRSLLAWRRQGLEVPRGRRFTSAGYGFAAPTMEMAGAAEAGGTLEVSFTLDPDLPTHPLRHQYHPDHDNLGDDYRPLTGAPHEAEVPTIKRSMRFTLDEDLSPEDGSMTGSYSEIIDGLLAMPLAVSGRLEATHISALELAR